MGELEGAGGWVIGIAEFGGSEELEHIAEGPAYCIEASRKQ